jgi:hypothetical protein
MALLSGCASVAVMSSVPLASLSRLSSLTLSDIDPAELRVAARLPASLEPRPLGVKVTLDLSGAGRGPEVFVLEPATEQPELAPLAAYRRDGTRLWVYRLSREDVVRLRRLMADATRAAGVSIAAGVDACHRAPLGSAALPTTTLLRTNATGYFVLAADLDLAAVVPADELAARVPPCRL